MADLESDSHNLKKLQAHIFELSEEKGNSLWGLYRIWRLMSVWSLNSLQMIFSNTINSILNERSGMCNQFEICDSYFSKGNQFRFQCFLKRNLLKLIFAMRQKKISLFISIGKRISFIGVGVILC